MAERENYSSNTPWEPVAGYSRAVRVGEHIFVSGTTATNAAGEIVGVGDITAQTRQAIRNIESALAHYGASLADVVRTRIYITDMRQWEAVLPVHGEFFGSIRPASTLVEVSALVSPDMLIEIEADAIVGIC
jgi:enamine deaminase RidA (YjgF/YER057c/UK114 family)